MAVYGGTTLGQRDDEWSDDLISGDEDEEALQQFLSTLQHSTLQFKGLGFVLLSIKEY